MTGARVLTFVEAPNFEAPTDANRDNVYKVTVVATDDEDLTGEQAVTVIVDNIDEAGEVKLSSVQPQAGVALTATLVDPDGGETNMKWQWSSANTDGTGAVLHEHRGRHVGHLHAARGRPCYGRRRRGRRGQVPPCDGDLQRRTGAR